MNILMHCFVFTLAFSSSFAVAANEPRTGEAFGFAIENDSRNIGGPGSDQAYSNGFKFSYIYAEDRVPVWAIGPFNKIDFLRPEVDQSKTNFGLSLGHQIYTPNNTDVTTLITEDRPYGAWVFVGLAAHVKTPKRGHFFEVDLGVVGPEAMGEQVQNGYHRLIQGDPVQGWKNQLASEPTLEVSYQQRFKFLEMADKWGKYLDVIPYAGANVGNVLVGAHAGGLVRFGYNLPDDLGPSRPSASDGDSFVTPTSAMTDERKSFYAFAGGRGNAVLRSIFLDGNTFRSSHHVRKYPFTTETEFGLGAQVIPWSLVWRFVVRSPEFEEKSRFNSFASINITYFFK